MESLGRRNLGQWTHFEGEEPGHWGDSSPNEQVVLGTESEAKARGFPGLSVLLDKPEKAGQELSVSSFW